MYSIPALVLAAIAFAAVAPVFGSRAGAARSRGEIAFMRASPSDFASHIFVMNPDGSAERQLTRGKASDLEPSWSPDGRRLTFVRATKSSGRDIYGINADGTGLRRLTRNLANESDVAWSPDGRTIAYSRAAPFAREQAGLFLMNADGGKKRRVGPRRNLVEISWSPDGRKIAFTTNTGVIFVVNVDGSGERRLTRNRSFYSPAWSPDGSKIAFVTMPGHYDSIYAVDLAGGGERLVTRHAYTEPGFAWSPDGRRLVYSREQRGGVYGIDVDGRHDLRLTRNPVPRHLLAGFAWSRDGGTIAYTSDCTGNGDIYLMRSDGTGQRQITNGPEIDGKPIWWEPR